MSLVYWLVCIEGSGYLGAHWLHCCLKTRTLANRPCCGVSPVAARVAFDVGLAAQKGRGAEFLVEHACAGGY